MSILKQILLIIYHPIDCMTIIKREKKFSYLQVILFYGAAVLANVFYAYTVHYPLATKSQESISFVLEAAIFVVPLFSWVLCSYLITALIDGESTFKDQLLVSCYCTVPYTMLKLIAIIASQFLSLEELGFFNVINYSGLLWMVILLFTSLVILNDYSISKGFGITVISIFAIVILWALLVLLYALTVQTFSLVVNLIKEINFKLM